MEGEGSRVFRSNNRTGGIKMEKEKVKDVLDLADPKRSQGCIEVLRIGKLLLLIH